MSADSIKLNRDTLVAAIGDGWSPGQVNNAIKLLAEGPDGSPFRVRHLPAELTRPLQREWLMLAVLKAVAERGYPATTVLDVTEIGGVQRTVFYEHFAGKEDCFLAAFDAHARRLQRKVAMAFNRGGGDWRDRLRRAIAALLQFAANEPSAARALIVEARAGGPNVVLRRTALADTFATHLDERAQALLPDCPTRPPGTAAAVVGGIDAVLSARLLRDEHEALMSLLPSLMYFAALHYESHQAASGEIEPPLVH